MTLAPPAVRAPRGATRTARGWIQEAAKRILMNNLDPEVAEHPDQLIVYGGRGKAARDWESYHRIVRTLDRLGDDETLLVQSGTQVAVLETHPMAPRVCGRKREPSIWRGRARRWPRTCARCSRCAAAARSPSTTAATCGRRPRSPAWRTRSATRGSCPTSSATRSARGAGAGADFLILDAADWRELPYALGRSAVARAFVAGRACAALS